jgi:hypothetical protein
MPDDFAGCDPMLGARIDTFPALIQAQTAHGNPAQLRMKLLRLRAVAPGASQGASLQKNRGADSRPILNGKALYVVNPPGELLFHIRSNLARSSML